MVYFRYLTHWGHKNIVKGCSNWPNTSRCRPFTTLHEHNTALTNNINKHVKEDDILIHLGDWSFGGFDNIEKFKNHLICQNIHLILGNHDSHIKRNRDEVQKLFSSVNLYEEITINKQLIILSHYSYRVWNESHKGSWHLYGHSHGTLPSFGKSMDCGVDTHPEFRPYSLDEIVANLSKKTIEYVDHHNKNTN